MLGANAEVIVAPMVRKANGGMAKPSDNQDLSTHISKISQAQCLRVLALDELSDEQRELIAEEGPFTVQVHPDSWIEADLTNRLALRLTKVIPPHAEKVADDETRDPEDLVVGTSAVYVKAVASYDVPVGHVAISKQVQDALDAENFSIVRYETTGYVTIEEDGTFSFRSILTLCTPYHSIDYQRRIINLPNYPTSHFVQLQQLDLLQVPLHH